MINTYEEFKASLEKSIVFRAKNFAVTDCDFDNIMHDVYDDIMRDIKVKWVTQIIIFEQDVYNYFLPNDNSVDNVLSDDIEYYGESFDIVSEDYNDVSLYVSEPHNGMFIVDLNFCNRNVDNEIYVLRPVVPPIHSLDAVLYRAIKTAMVEGIMYQIQDSIPSQVDGQLGNMGYQRFFAAKEVLRKKYPQRKWLDGRQVGSQSKLGGYNAYSR